VTPLACVMLGGVMIVAIATTALKKIKATSPLGWLSEFLYLPDVLYLVILFYDDFEHSRSAPLRSANQRQRGVSHGPRQSFRSLAETIFSRS
jgi:hypothetical protein